MSEYRLDELCEILDSKRVPLSAMQRAKRHGPYPYYGAQSVIDYVDDYLLDGEYLLVAEDGANLVTRTQDIANLVNGKIWVNNHAHILGYNGKCPLRLLGFLLNHSNISPYVTGCAQPKLNQDNLRRITFSLPEKVDEVSSILSSLDSKIENNRKICANLEAQAQALFKHWFIDFAPFKDGKFVESELGMIPEGWRVGKLGDLTEFLNGFAFKSSSFVSKGKYKVITIKAVQDGKLITDSADEIEDLSLNIPSHCVLKIGDILLSLTGNVGRVCIVTQDNLVLNQRVCILNPRNLIDRGYVYTLSRTKLLKTRMINIAKGTAQANLSPVETSKLSIVVPPRYILDKFGIIANEYMSEIISAYQENQRLSSLRDTLLPKLMSGEIKV